MGFLDLGKLSRGVLWVVCLLASGRVFTASAEYAGTYVPVGVSLGWTSGSGESGGADERDGGFTLGLETSYVVVTRENNWYGGYLDLMVTPNDEELRVSVGPEGGFFIFGADGGLVMRADTATGEVNVGLQARGLLTLLPVMMPYVGGGFFFDGSPGLFEAGLLFKYPIDL
jgi:hypothetical protein